MPQEGTGQTIYTRATERGKTYLSPNLAKVCELGPVSIHLQLTPLCVLNRNSKDNLEIQNSQGDKQYLFTHYQFLLCLQCLLMVISWHPSLTFGQSVLEQGIKPPAMLPACISWLGLHLSSTAALQMETFLMLRDCRSSFLVLSAPVSLHCAGVAPLSTAIKCYLQRTHSELCSAVWQQPSSHHLSFTQCGQLGRRQDWIPSHYCYESITEYLKPEKSQRAPNLPSPTYIS